ncbi:MAG: hypothetical protein WCA19_23320 [Candidatus Acidiferrales bacterium]
MRKTLSASHLALCGLCVLGLFGCSSSGQLLTTDLSGQQAAAQPAATPTEHSNGIVMDWSTSHTLYPRVGEINALVAVQHDPRAILSWQAAERQDFLRVRGPRHFLPVQSDVNRDWSINLGIGGVAPTMYPAKFTFDVNAAPTCTAVSPAIPDYAVFPVNVAGSATQPNIVAFDNLYSGTTPSNGICNRAVPPPGDSGIAATTFWSYNITAAGGKVATSPTLSLDGTKVAFVESGSGVAHFHVLAWKAGDGVDITTPSAQNVLKPVSITSGFAALAPVAGTGTVTDLALGSADDTLSSPFVDYTNDVAYIGNDSGVLFRVINVFCTTSACTGGGTPAPSLDPTWGSSGALTIGGSCTGKLTGAVIDGGTGHVLVGCADGNVYGFDSTGASLGTAVTVGNGAATGGIVDPLMIDAVNGFLYAVSGASAGGTSVMVQAKTTDLSGVVTLPLGAGGSHNLHSPAFNSGYFSSVNPTHWLLYEWALSSGGTNIELYGATFSAGHIMNNAINPSDEIQIGGSSPVDFSPLTEFLNGSSDQVFVSGLTAASPNFIEYNMNIFINLFPNSFPPSGISGATTTETGGTSGMVVDNTSGSAQASSIYFGNLSTNAAVKLTQSGLN